MRMLGPISTEFVWPRRTWSSPAAVDVFADFDQIVESFLRPTYANTVNFQPSCDVNETKEHYLVSFDMPGMKKEDIKIEIQGNELVISGERHREVSEKEGESTLRHERMYGKFERSFTLPTTIATDKIEAHYEDGVLNVALPKAESSKARTIQIQTGQGGLLSKFLGSKKETNKELKDVKVF
ncbi:MAG: Hsp20/alpha crystallin family protein [Pseudobdellovibrio sp.]